MSSFLDKSAPLVSKAASLGDKAEAFAAAWAEARLVYPLYSFLAAKFDLSAPPYRETNLPLGCPAPDVFERVARWLEELDGQVRTNQLRQLLPAAKNISPESLRAVISRLLRKPEKTAADRDNIDFLLAQYFALCAPDDLYTREIGPEDVARVLREVVEEADATPLEWCAPLERILEEMKQCRSLRDAFAGKLLEQGRELKDSAGFMFYDPAALVAFTRFNFLLRRSFIRLLHVDLRAVREALTELERRGVTVLDCRSAGLSAEEPVARLREMALEWRQPRPADYGEESAGHTFEQLLEIRTVAENALGGALYPPASRATDEAVHPEAAAGQDREPASPVEVGKAPETEKVPAAHDENSPTPLSTEPSLARPAAVSHAEAVGKKVSRDARPAPSPGSVPPPELEQCLEDIWEQLIAAPPARGRSMSTVVLCGARILLSAWEVNAFVSEGGQLSDDLRRAVAARALIALAREERTRSGNPAPLNAALALARREMAYLQERVDQAQRTKDTEAAVNLGISARRLLSTLEEVQQS